MTIKFFFQTNIPLVSLPVMVLILHDLLIAKQLRLLNLINLHSQVIY